MESCLRSLTVFVKCLIILFLAETYQVLADTCPNCGSIVEGDAYTEGLVKGIANITTVSGTPCTQIITCSRLDASPDGLVSISGIVEGVGYASLGYDTTTVSVTLECGSNGKYILPEYPQYSLTNTIFCESTPAASQSTTIITPTTTPTTAPNTCPSCGSIVEGNSYTEGLVKGIANITTVSGTPCTQTITCSRLDASPNGFVYLSANVEEIGNVNFGYDVSAVSITLECGPNGKYIVPGFPQYPLTNTIFCESTPVA